MKLLIEVNNSFEKKKKLSTICTKNYGSTKYNVVK